MATRYRWVPIVLLLVFLLGYRVVWPWYRDRPARAAADALIADLTEHGSQVARMAGSLPEVAEQPERADLEAQLRKLLAELGEATDRSRRLVERVTETLPQVPADKQDELRAAVEQYSARVKPAFEAYGARTRLLRKKVEELKARDRPGAGT